MKANANWTLGAALALALVSLTACNRDEADAVPTANETPPSTAEQPAPVAPAEAPAPAEPAPAAAMGEGEALGMLQAINEHEIAAAEQAKSKNVTGKVLDYANMMHAEHSKNMADTKALDGQNGVTIGSNAEVDAQRSKSQAELATLGALEGDAYAKAYIDAMVKGHTEALAALDGKLIPAAKAEPVKAHLTTTREHVAKHLEAAKALQTP